MKVILKNEKKKKARRSWGAYRIPPSGTGPMAADHSVPRSCETLLRTFLRFNAEGLRIRYFSVAVISHDQGNLEKEESVGAYNFGGIRVCPGRKAWQT